MLGFYVQPTAKVIRRRENGEQESNARPIMVFGPSYRLKVGLHPINNHSTVYLYVAFEIKIIISDIMTMKYFLVLRINSAANVFVYVDSVDRCV